MSRPVVPGPFFFPIVILLTFILACFFIIFSLIFAFPWAPALWTYNVKVTPTCVLCSAFFSSAKQKFGHLKQFVSPFGALTWPSCGACILAGKVLLHKEQTVYFQIFQSSHYTV